jgi:hypothetical protein
MSRPDPIRRRGINLLARVSIHGGTIITLERAESDRASPGGGMRASAEKTAVSVAFTGGIKASSALTMSDQVPRTTVCA